MTDRITKSINFSPLKSKKVECSFTGGKITSDGGISFLREVDKKLHLTKQIASVIPDKRNPSYTKHTVLQMVRQRVYGLALGYEDLNDHDNLRHDGAMQMAVGFDSLWQAVQLCAVLSGSSTVFGESISTQIS